MDRVMLRDKVNVALDKIRPFLVADEGDIELVDITDEFDVHIKMLGACRSCQLVDMTIQSGVEQFIRREAPEIRFVIPVN